MSNHSKCVFNCGATDCPAPSRPYVPMTSPDKTQTPLTDTLIRNYECDLNETAWPNLEKGIRTLERELAATKIVVRECQKEVIELATAKVNAEQSLAALQSRLDNVEVPPYPLSIRTGSQLMSLTALDGEYIHKQDYDTLRQHCAALSVKCQGLEKDSARYRWLRDKSVPPHNFYLSVPVEFADEKYTPQQVDAAIDAARGAL